MKRIARLVLDGAKEIWSLLVDDGFLAIVALIAIAATYLLSRDGMLGAVDAVGWILLGLLLASMLVSVRRALAAHRPARATAGRNGEHGRGDGRAVDDGVAPRNIF